MAHGSISLSQRFSRFVCLHAEPHTHVLHSWLPAPWATSTLTGSLCLARVLQGWEPPTVQLPQHLPVVVFSSVQRHGRRVATVACVSRACVFRHSKHLVSFFCQQGLVANHRKRNDCGCPIGQARLVSISLGHLRRRSGVRGRLRTRTDQRVGWQVGGHPNGVQLLH